MFSPSSTLNVTLFTSLPSTPSSPSLSQDHPCPHHRSVLSIAGHQCQSMRTGLLVVASNPVTRARRTSSSSLLTVWELSWIISPYCTGSFLVPGPIYPFSVSRNLGSSFRLLLEFALHPFTDCNALCDLQGAVRMARQPKQWAVRPYLSNVSLVRRILLGDDWWYSIRRYAPLSPRASGKSTRMSTYPARSSSGDHGVPLMFCANSPSHLSSNSGLSHRPASDPSRGCSDTCPGVK